MRVVLASRNRKKVAELAAMLNPLSLEIVPVNEVPEVDEVEETGDTFEANAILKAESVAAQAGLPAIADDSGLVVDALDGAPGVLSARFSGEDATDASNNALLLEKLTDVPQEKRTARFVCVIAVAVPGLETVLFRGETEGRILNAQQGAGGFGYDPLFFSDDLHACFGDVDASQKNSVSHRGRALRQLAEALRQGDLSLTMESKS